MESVIILGGLAYASLALLLRGLWIRSEVIAAIDAGEIEAGGTNREVIAWVAAAMWPVFVGQAAYKLFKRSRKAE